VFIFFIFPLVNTEIIIFNTEIIIFNSEIFWIYSTFPTTIYLSLMQTKYCRKSLYKHIGTKGCRNYRYIGDTLN